jgi:hypothetical protein
MKIILTFLLMMITTITLAGPRVVGNGFLEEKEVPTTETETRKVDKIDYPFINDSRVTQNHWCSVDLLSKIESFKVGQRVWKNDLYLRKIIFSADGNICWDYEYKEKECQTGEKLENLNWTKSRYEQENISFDGVITHKTELTSSGYLLKNIRGQQFLFLQHKSGVYKEKGKVSNYYVFQVCPQSEKK